MASNGLANRAKKGVCRMCMRSRCTDKHVEPVGEVHHGFAVGHLWQCIEEEDCQKAIEKKLAKYPPGSLIHKKIKFAVSRGRW